jgi:hypothetical protein
MYNPSLELFQGISKKIQESVFFMKRLTFYTF